MRMGFGLIGLLMVVALIAYLGSKDAETSSRANKAVQQQMAPVTGRGGDGEPMEKSADFAMKPNGLAVTRVTAGGYFDQFYGLKQDDVILEAGDAPPFKGTDEGSAITFLLDQAPKKKPIVVLREGQRVTLNIKDVPAK